MTAAKVTPGETNALRISNAINKNADEADGSLKADQNLSDVDDAATSFDNIKQAATASYSGVVELATDDEVATGTDTVRAVTPAGLRAVSDGSSSLTAEIRQLSRAVAGIIMANAEAAKKAQKNGNGFADGYDTATYIEAGSSSNFSRAVVDSDSDGLNDWVVQPTQSAISLIPASTGTVIGNFTTRQSAAFDDDTSQTAAQAAQRVVDPAQGEASYLGKDYSASPKKIEKIVFFGSSNSGYNITANKKIVLGARAKNGSPPTSATDGDSIATPIKFTDGSTALSKTLQSHDKITDFDYAWGTIEHQHTAQSTLAVAEVRLYEAAVPNNMTLVSKKIQTAATVARVRFWTEVQLIDLDLVFNTDLVMSVSANDGTNYTDLTMEDLSLAGPVRILRSDFTAPGVLGAALRYKIVSANSVMFRVRRSFLEWDY